MPPQSSTVLELCGESALAAGGVMKGFELGGVLKLLG